jgi:hypothetical protein
MKKDSLFVNLRSPKPYNSSCHAQGTIWKLSMIRGAMGLFHYVSIYNKEVIEFIEDSFH